MKITFLTCFLTIVLNWATAQDTLNKIVQFDNRIAYLLVNKRDTIQAFTYPTGRIESKIRMKKGEMTGLYQRFYENGNIMWEKQLVKGKAEGLCIFYDGSGNKTAEIEMKEDTLYKTQFIQPGKIIYSGHIHSTSVVHGGMQREDGSSNISRHEGPYRNVKMVLAKVFKNQAPMKVEVFETDQFGNFMVVLNPGEYGFFQHHISLDKVPPGMYIQEGGTWMSGHSSAGISPSPGESLGPVHSFKIHFSSVGYAP